MSFLEHNSMDTTTNHINPWNVIKIMRFLLISQMEKEHQEGKIGGDIHEKRFRESTHSCTIQNNEN